MNDIFTPLHHNNSTFATDLIHKSTNQFKSSTMEQLKKLFLCLLALLTSTIMYAQAEISGTVIDATGETVLGANGMEKGPANGTSTEFAGNFPIRVDQGTTCDVSSRG